MKAQTLSNKKVKDFIKNNKAKLYMYDEEKKEHGKYFAYYKIRSFPTIIFLRKDNLENPVYRSSGFMSAEIMIQKMKEKLTDE